MVDLLLKWFVPNYKDTKEPRVRERYGTLSGTVGIILNLCLTAAKLAAGILTGAVSVTADAFNNLSDAATSLVTLLGFRLAGRKADEDHPFGHGRYEYLAGLAVSVAVLLVGLELAKGAVEKILRPETVAFSPLSVGILIGSILVKLWLYRFNSELSRRVDSAAMGAVAADSLSDSFATAAVLAGLLVSHFFHISVDGWVGILVSAFVLRAGWEAVRDTLDPLLGKAPDPTLVKGIEETVLAHEEISGVHDLVVHDYGPGHIMATLHAEVSMDGDIGKTHDVIDNVERELRDKFHILATIHMDPIVTNDARVTGLREEMLTLANTLDARITIHDFRMTEGPTHINLIFDLVVPLDCPLSEEEIRREMARLARERDEKYITVIEIDRPYV